MTTPQIIRGALVWRSGFAVDADGAPNAYAPPGLLGLDALGNAGHPGNWWGVVTNDGGNPVVQGPDDPAPGFYVSTTALVDHSKAQTDPRRYVDAASIPYASIASDLTGQRGVRMGDVAMVVYQGRAVGAVCADVSPRGKYGEGSIALAQALGIPASPRKGGVGDGVAWLIFPGSHATPAWPRSVQDFQAQAAAMYQAWGGDAALALL